MSYLFDDSIKFEPTAQLTAFNRLRIADSRLLGEYRYMYGSGTTTEIVDSISGSGVLVKDQPRNCYLAQVGTDSGAKAVRQTRQYHPYISGTSNVGMVSFVMDTAQTGLTQAVGMFDDSNGFIFRVRDSVAELVIRKSGVDVEVIPQSQWNGDTLLGNSTVQNKSGVLADWTKAQILVIDYQWLGVGKVRFGFCHNDDIITVHSCYHANIATEVYTNQPSLPCRWEIKNTTSVTSASELMVICAAVYCEGSDSETGFSRSISTETTPINVTTANSSNGKGIIAIRLKNVLEGKQNHSLARLKNYSVYSNNDMNYKVVILPNASYLQNSPTWLDVPGYGWCEYIKDFTLTPTWNASDDFHVLVDDFAIGGNGNSSSTFSSLHIDNRSSAIMQNYDATDSQILAIIGYKMSTDASVKASISWIEVK
jgi:hypothetical protein